MQPAEVQVPKVPVLLPPEVLWLWCGAGPHSLDVPVLFQPSSKLPLLPPFFPTINQTSLNNPPSFSSHHTAPSLPNVDATASLSPVCGCPAPAGLPSWKSRGEWGSLGGGWGRGRGRWGGFLRPPTRRCHTAVQLQWPSTLPLRTGGCLEQQEHPGSLSARDQAVPRLTFH